MSGKKPYLPRLIATSVVRGSEQGDSHGGIFTVDFATREAIRHVDWNTSDIDFTGRGWDRGLYIQRQRSEWLLQQFNPGSTEGPDFANTLHLNMVCIHDTGIYFSGLHTGAMLHLGKEFRVSEVCNLPACSHNARPFRDGVLFNDTKSDCVRYVGRSGGDRAFRIKHYPQEEIRFAGIDDSTIARQGFGRGLCPLSDRFVAGGSSPSTITIYDLHTNKTVVSVNLSMDIRNAIHDLEIWPYG